MGIRYLSLTFAACVLFLTVASTTAAGPQLEVRLPDTGPGRLADGWLKVCRTHDAVKIKAWTLAHLSVETAKHAPVDAIAQQEAETCSLNGGYRVAEIKRSEDQAVEWSMVGLKTSIWYQMKFDADASGKIMNAGIWPIMPAESALPKDLSDSALATQVKSIVAQRAKLGLFSGIVSVARGTQVIASASGGYANREKKTPITGSTQFALGSMGKMFTAAAVGQLVDQGKMTLDDNVGKFFPDYPNQSVRDKVTMRMLLSHTAGMGDFLRKATPAMVKEGIKRASEIMPLFDKDEPLFEPGTKWDYSNAGLALVGAIVEKASGEDYPDYLRKHIFAVAGMTNSDPNNIPHTSSLLATPYTKMTEKGRSLDWHATEPGMGLVGTPAGGALSTADDLIRFADALRNGKLVSKAVFAEMTKPWRTSEHYGLAMEIEDVFDRPVVGHGGGFPGVSTHLYLLLDSPYTVVVLANQDSPYAVMELANQDPRSDVLAGWPALALTVEKAKAESKRNP
ncbi:MAG: beta-lactamase family protein [Proteobacteria bacterium]|uniref:serine hydrolase domain-containing protein n=1 Tax=Rudaea sp. TaxID=2136325 RepID=UPI00378489E8|nr:beta-lactamase family protein [Pseudomonadota bacterium]